MKKLLLLTSILTLIFSSFSFAKTYAIKKEKEGKYVEFHKVTLKLCCLKGKYSNNKYQAILLLILLNMTRRYFIVLPMFF